jgi:hypothetical protein
MDERNCTHARGGHCHGLDRSRRDSWRRSWWLSSGAVGDRSAWNAQSPSRCPGASGPGAEGDLAFGLRRQGLGNPSTTQVIGGERSPRRLAIETDGPHATMSPHSRRAGDGDHAHGMAPRCWTPFAVSSDHSSLTQAAPQPSRRVDAPAAKGNGDPALLVCGLMNCEMGERILAERQLAVKSSRKTSMPPPRQRGHAWLEERSVYPMRQLALSTSSSLPLAAERTPASRMAMISTLFIISIVGWSGSPVFR